MWNGLPPRTRVDMVVGLRDILVYLEKELPAPGKPANRTTCLTYKGKIAHYSFLTNCNGNANAR